MDDTVGTGKALGTPVMFGDVIHLRAGLALDQQRVVPGAQGGYLDTRGTGAKAIFSVSLLAEVQTEIAAEGWTAFWGAEHGGYYLPRLVPIEERFKLAKRFTCKMVGIIGVAGI